MRQDVGWGDALRVWDGNAIKYGCDDCIYNNENGLCDIRIAKVEKNSYCRIKKRKIKVI